MAICCNPGHVSMWLEDVFPRSLTAKIEHSGSEVMRSWADAISANSNFDDIVGFVLEGETKQAIDAYIKAFQLYRSAQSRLDRVIKSMPVTSAQFVEIADKKLPRQIKALGLNARGLDYNAFFGRRHTEFQQLKNKIDTIIAMEKSGRALLEKNDISMLWQLMAESIRSITETISKISSANVADSRLFGEFSQLIMEIRRR